MSQQASVAKPPHGFVVWIDVPGLLLQAYHAFTEDQRRQLRRHLAALHHAPINTLEFIGGALPCHDAGGCLQGYGPFGYASLACIS